MDIVTAFTDIGRGTWSHNPWGVPVQSYIPRTVDTYIERFERMASLKNHITCFVDSDLLLRLPKNSNIEYHDIREVTGHEWNVAVLDKIKGVHSSDWWISRFRNDASPERWNSDYVFINWMKSQFLIKVFRDKYCLETTFAWLDFGYFRTEPKTDFLTYQIPEGKELVFFSNGKTKHEINEVSPIDAVMSGEVFIQGCHVIGTSVGFRSLGVASYDYLDTLVNIGLIDDDQTMLLMAYKGLHEMIHLQYNSSTNWFGVFAK